MPIAVNVDPHLKTTMKNVVARVAKCLTASSAGSALDTTRASLITISPVLERPPRPRLSSQGLLTQARSHSADSNNKTDKCFLTLNERYPLCVWYSRKHGRRRLSTGRDHCHLAERKSWLVCFETHSRSSINAVAEISLSLFFVRSHADSAAPETTTKQVKLPAGPLCSVAG